MDTQSLTTFLENAEAPAEAPALVAYTEAGEQHYTRRQLFEAARCVASELTAAKLGPGDQVMIIAANSPAWVVTALGVLKAGCTLVPVDAQMRGADLEHVLDDAAPARIYADPAVIDSDIQWPGPSPQPLPAPTPGVDTVEPPAPPAQLPDGADTAVIFYTSGTTGPPKGVPLSHTNLLSNVQGLIAEGIARPDDRVLLPLPLHHVYPFSIGLLTVIGLGATLIMPRSLVGPRIAGALYQSRATILLGVPRLYEALWQRLEARLTDGRRWRERVLEWLMTGSQWCRRRTGLHPGRWLFRPVIKRLAPTLRLAVSGGAALDPGLGRRLQTLGWQVATGYGLTETSPILTLNPPGEARLETAGRPLPGVSLRIIDGEVCARGDNVFEGYRGSPTGDGPIDADGWLHTGDAGWIDDDGFLHLQGRLSATIVLPGGENIDPERIERVLNAQPALREAGVLADDDRLAAVVVPEPDHDPADAEAAVTAAARQLPGHHAIARVQVSVDPLPRTRLGKLRRPHLKRRYEALAAGTQAPRAEPIAIEAMMPEDQALLSDPVAGKTWDYLASRFADRRLTPDSHLHRDLDIDSLGWIDLALALREQSGVELADEAIAEVTTVRDLLQAVIQAREVEPDADGSHLVASLQQPESLLDDRDQRALAPRGVLRHLAARVVLAGCLLISRRYARIEVEGEWPELSGCLITPRHISAFDPIVLTAILPRRHLPGLFWAGWTGLLFSTALRRRFSDIARILPIDPGSAPRRSLALAAACLERRHPLVWFPEGQRHTGEGLGDLRPGIGMLLKAQPRPVVPVWIEGTDQVLPVGQLWPRRGQVVIRIGAPIEPGEDGADERAIVARIEQAMRSLSSSARAD